MDEADFDSIDCIAENSGRWPSARPSLAEFWEHALQALKRAVRGGNHRQMADPRDSPVDRPVGRGAEQPGSLSRFFRSADQFHSSRVSIQAMPARLAGFRQPVNSAVCTMGGIRRSGEAVRWMIDLVALMAQVILHLRDLSRSTNKAAAAVMEEG